MVAAHWLIEYDSEALRRLAGLNGSEGWLIDQLWPEVLSDLGVQEADDECEWDLSVAFQLAALRAGDRSIEQVMNQVIRPISRTTTQGMCPRPGICTGWMTNLVAGGEGRLRRSWPRPSRRLPSGQHVGLSHRRDDRSCRCPCAPCRGPSGGARPALRLRHPLKGSSWDRCSVLSSSSR